MVCDLAVSHAKPESVIGGFVGQWPPPLDFCEIGANVEDFERTVDIEANPSSRSGGIIGLNINTIGTIVVNRAVIVKACSKIFKQNRCFYIKPLAASLVGHRNH